MTCRETLPPLARWTSEIYLPQLGGNQVSAWRGLVKSWKLFDFKVAAFIAAFKLGFFFFSFLLWVLYLWISPPPPRLLKTMQCLIFPFLDACSCFQIVLMCVYLRHKWYFGRSSHCANMKSNPHRWLVHVCGGNTVWGGSVKSCSSSCVAMLTVPLGH